jgi:hypothetical protein
MNKILTLCFSLFFILTCFANAAEDTNSSKRTYNHIDEQKVFNLIKKIYKTASSRYIIDTSWDKVVISKRTTQGFLDLDVKIDFITLKIIPQEDQNISEFEFTAYSEINEKKTFELPDSILHKIFWNRIEYALGIDTQWIDCKTSFTAILLTQNPLCTIEKNQLSP